jgi:hypothetical protein
MTIARFSCWPAQARNLNGAGLCCSLQRHGNSCAAGPFAIKSQTFDAAPHVQEVWVNGRLIRRYGDFSHPCKGACLAEMLVFGIRVVDGFGPTATAGGATFHFTLRSVPTETNLSGQEVFDS